MWREGAPLRKEKKHKSRIGWEQGGLLFKTSFVLNTSCFERSFLYKEFGAQPASKRRRREDSPLAKERAGVGFVSLVFSKICLQRVQSAASVEKKAA